LLLDGVDLPDLVRLAAAAAVLRRRAPGAAVDAGAAEPALERALRGHGAVGPLAAEPLGDEDGAPGGVEAFQPAGGADRAGKAAGPGLGAAAVVGGQAVGPAATGAACELADGGGRDAELLGDGGDGVALVEAFEDGLSDGYGDGAGHGSPPGL